MLVVSLEHEIWLRRLLFSLLTLLLLLCRCRCCWGFLSKRSSSCSPSLFDLMLLLGIQVRKLVSELSSQTFVVRERRPLLFQDLFLRTFDTAIVTFTSAIVGIIVFAVLIFWRISIKILCFFAVDLDSFKLTRTKTNACRLKTIVLVAFVAFVSISTVCFSLFTRWGIVRIADTLTT